MKREKAMSVLRDCAEHNSLCRVRMRYDRDDFYYYPLKLSESFFLGAAQHDFILDGFAIRKIDDVVAAEKRTDFCSEIDRKEGLLDELAVPEVDLTSWDTIFADLLRRGKNIIVKRESRFFEGKFYIGRIERIEDGYLEFRHFDANGVWMPEAEPIFFGEITSVIFESRYVEVFSRYVPALPENFAKDARVASERSDLTDASDAETADSEPQ